MDLYGIKKYTDEIDKISSGNFPWKELNKKSILISGARGLIGSLFIDVLMEKNVTDNLECHIYAIGRDAKLLEQRFVKYVGSKFFHIMQFDVNKEMVLPSSNIDYVFHLASNTHPVFYASYPISTIETNIIGTSNMLKIATDCHAKRFFFASSCEVYGENKGDVDLFDEKYCGYIDCNTLRAGYPESKRCGEALCQAYIKEKGLDCVIARFSRVYGPTMLLSDSKALSQFMKNALNNEDIVLKSDGKQFYSYIHVYDAVTALLTILFYGQSGDAYNVSDEKSNIHLRDLAKIIAERCGRKVVFDLPDATESAGFSKATKALLDDSKLKRLNWNPYYDIKSGVANTIDILKELLYIDK